MVLAMAELAYFFDERIFALVLKNIKNSSCTNLTSTVKKKHSHFLITPTIHSKYTL